MTAPHNRTVLLAIAVLILINAVLLFSMRLLPFTDLPNHLVEAAVYKYAAPGTSMGQYYEAVPWYYPNTFHTVFCSLFPSVEWGNKVFFVLYVAIFLLSVYAIIRALNGNLWFGLFSLLFLYNYNVTSGFVGFAIAVPVTLLLFYVILLDAKKARPVYMAAAAFLLVLLYLMHAQVGLFGLVLYGLAMLYRHWGNWKMLVVKAVLVPLPVVLLVAAWWRHRAAAAPGEKSTLAYLKEYYLHTYIPSFPMRARIAVFDNFSLQAGVAGLLIAGLLFLPVLLPLLYRKSRRLLTDATFLKTNLAYPLIFLLVSAGCYFGLPDKLPGQSPIYERMAVLVSLALIIIGAVLLRDVPVRGLRFLALGAAVVYLGLWGDYMVQFNRQNRDFTPAFFADVPDGSVLGGLMYKYLYRGRYVYLHFPGYYTVWKNGLATSKAIDYRFGVIRRGPQGEVIPRYREWIGRNYSFESTYEKTLGYVLAHGKAPAQPDSNLLNKTEIRRAGAWQLYKNNAAD
jgi:hypothetical protein